MAAALSLLAPGLGQAYCGEPARGGALLLSALVPLWALPLHVMTAGISSIKTEYCAICALACCALCASVIDAALLARRRQNMAQKAANRAAVYIVYALTAWALTAATLSVFTSSFPLHRAHEADAGPKVRQGRLILVNGLSRGPWQPGELVMTGSGWLARIMTAPGDRAALRDGRLVINGLALEHRAPADAEAARLFASSPERLYLETNRGATYAIEQELPRKLSGATTGIPLKKGQTLAARDNRLNEGWWRVIEAEDILGRAESLF